jgi:hypothetical protein
MTTLFDYQYITEDGYQCVSADGISWIDGLRDADESFPLDDAGEKIDPARMTKSERDDLVAYLRRDDGSLSADVLAFSRSVAAEIESLQDLSDLIEWECEYQYDDDDCADQIVGAYIVGSLPDGTGCHWTVSPTRDYEWPEPPDSVVAEARRLAAASEEEQ